MKYVICTLAGKGTRLAQEVPKQFLTIYDKPLFIYTLEKFEQHEEIDAIAVSCLEGWEDYIRTYCKQFNITKLKWVIEGGQTGMESIQNVVFNMKEICRDQDIIIVQDGIRVNTSKKIISDCIELTKNEGNACAYIPIAEAPFLRKDGDLELLDRSKLLRTQTPHGIRYGELVEIHKIAIEKEIYNSVATCTLLHTLGREVYFYSGSETNLKITSDGDIKIFKALLKYKKSAWE